jgi:hypothetical protein
VRAPGTVHPVPNGNAWLLGRAGDEHAGLAALIAALEAGSGADLAGLLGGNIRGTVGASARTLGALGATATLATSLAVSAVVRDQVGAEHG